MPEFDLTEPEIPVTTSPAKGKKTPPYTDLPGGYSFLAKIPASNEAELRTNPNPPLRFSLPQGTNFDEVASGIRSLHPAVQVDVNKAEGVLTVIMPPSIKVGADPVGLPQVAYVLRCQRDLEQLKFLDTWEACCGNGRGGCCSNA